ncbi:MAG: exopolyphosphatase [Bacteroidota bacterium]|nr:exopolyphosphatase [Bacteroidota bacterium]
MKKYAAVDIGSNAIRLLIVGVLKTNSVHKYRKISLVRVPIRLGQDVFLYKKISNEKLKLLLNTLKAFKLLMSVHNIDRYKICATSAMRESKNSKKVLKRVRKKLNLDINIISGKDEASIIANVFAKDFNNHKNLLYVDVGGGSTELTIIDKGKIVESKSFKIGTIRILNNLVKKDTWGKYEEWIKKHTKIYNGILTIASGGNANKLLKISGKEIRKPMSIEVIKEIYLELNKYSFEDRVIKLNLSTDRADVIIPATEIYLKSMNFCKSNQIIIPRIGLADGIIRMISYDENFGNQLLY